jgi:hypothetical protein|nr:MAG TPA: hypothetical protein [Caudoviricetes sp.]DAT73721.1 MAG TPA: hypothetical protein [Caudoviricetes sp.]
MMKVGEIIAETQKCKYGANMSLKILRKGRWWVCEQEKKKASVF